MQQERRTMNSKKMDRLEEIFEAYNGLISSDELLQQKIAEIEVERKRVQEKKEEIYGEMARLQEEIRELLRNSQEDIDAPEKKKIGISSPEERKQKSEKRKKIDLERAKEMHAAGWSYAKIGKELGVSTQGVCNALNREKKMELTEEEKASCDRFAEELFGGGK